MRQAGDNDAADTGAATIGETGSLVSPATPLFRRSYSMGFLLPLPPSKCRRDRGGGQTMPYCYRSRAPEGGSGMLAMPARR